MDKPKEKRIEIVVGDYTADNEKSWLARLEELSQKRQDGGLLHGGHIHFIQYKMSEVTGLFLKAAIKMILDAVPSIFPYDFPEIVEKNENFNGTEQQIKTIREINENLILPIQGWEVVEVMKAAREYEALEEHEV